MEEKTTCRFIVIDDDPVNNHVCNKYIKLVFPGADIRTFIEPQEGLDYISSSYEENNRYKTILFLDINMPFLTGWDVLERFRHFPEAVKKHFEIYILSSSVAPEDKNRADSYPLVAGFIEKPLSMNRLQELIQTYLH